MGKINNTTVFNVLSIKYVQSTTPDGKPGRIKWQASRAVNVDERTIAMSIKKGDNWANVELQNGKLVGSSGSLSRFNPAKGGTEPCKGGTKPWVIFSQIMNNGRIIGYGVARSNGSMAQLKLDEVIKHAEQVTQAGGIPVQNAIFVPATADVKAHFRPYAGKTFIEDNWEYKENKNAVSAPRTTPSANEKRMNKAKKLEDIFTKEQIREIKAGHKSKVNFKLYADPKFTAEQMRELRKGLERGVEVRYVTHTAFKPDAMAYYIADLANKADIRPYLNPRYSVAQISELSIAYAKGLDLSKMSDPKLSAHEMSEIAARLEKGTWTEIQVKDTSKFGGSGKSKSTATGAKAKKTVKSGSKK